MNTTGVVNDDKDTTLQEWCYQTNTGDVVINITNETHIINITTLVVTQPNILLLLLLSVKIFPFTKKKHRRKPNWSICLF